MSNTPPIAGNDSYTTMSGAALRMSIEDILSNDNDSDGDSLSLTSYEILGEASGALVRLADDLYFHSDQGFEGVQTIQYTLSDEHGDTAVGTIDVTVQPAMHHQGNMDLQMEHANLMGLVDPSDATHIAVQDGNWSDAAIWQNVQTGEMEIPGADAQLFIPEGVSVTYEVDSGLTLSTLRADGQL